MATILQKHRISGRAVVAALASCAIHAAALLLLLLQSQSGIRGDMGHHYGMGGQGAGYDPVLAELVSQHAAGAHSPTEATPIPSGTVMPETPAPSQAQSPQLPNTVVSTAQGTAAQEIAGSGAAAGVPDGHYSLLEQIARCLPPNERPELKAASLHLSIDSSGHLTAAPRLAVDVTRLTQTQLRSANQIVQAAMQCGPYIVTQDHMAMIDIVPDFTVIPMATH